MQSQQLPPASCAVSNDVFLIINDDGSVTFAHDNAERLLGFPPPLLLGINAFTFFHVDDVPTVMSIITETISHGRESRAVELRVRADGDSWRTVALSASRDLALHANGELAFRLRGPEAVVQAADQIARQALHDRVTGLPNRALFVDRIDHAVARAERGARSVVVLAVGFNGYSVPPSRDARDVSDELIIAIARRLRSCLRASDTVARLSLDEFGILLEDINHAEHVNIVVDRIFQAMQIPFSDVGDEVTIVSNIGMVVSTPERSRGVELLHAASVARAWASVQGAGGYAPFDPSMARPEGEDATSQFRMTAVDEDSTDAGFGVSIDTEVAALHKRVSRLEQTISSMSGSGDIPE